MLRIPYSQSQLCLALMSIEDGKIDDKTMGDFVDGCDDFAASSQAEFDRRVAEWNGVTDLINSPNRDDLYQKYFQFVVEQLAQKLVERFGLTDVQAWSLIAFALGLI